MPRPYRSLGILAHIDAGKTSLTERLLLVAGAIRAAGSVDAGTTVTDSLRVERERGITVKAAAVGLSWRGHELALVDTPGHVDFGGEVSRSLRVIDGAVVLLCGVAGVQARTEAIHRACEARALPRLYFVNKLDRRGASFERVYAELRSGLDPLARAVSYPLGEEEAYGPILDLVSLSLVGSPAGTERGAGFETGLADHFDGLPPRALALRAELVEALAELDAGVMEAFVSGREPGEGELRDALRRATVSGAMRPLLCGSAFDEASAAFLLDAAVDFLPAPEEAALPQGLDPARRELAAFVYKTRPDPARGKLAWVRVWTGELRPGEALLEAPSGRKLAARAVFGLSGGELVEIPAAPRGGIVALSLVAMGGSKGDRPAALSGSTLCSPAAPVCLEPLAFAEPVAALALEPRTRADLEALRAAVEALVEGDPSLRWREDGSGRVLLEGQGELHLEVAIERLAEDFGVRARAGRPEVVLKEGLLRPARSEIRFERDENGERLAADLVLVLDSEAPAPGLRLDFAEGAEAAGEAAEALRRGLEASLSLGPSGGHPVERARARVESWSAGEGRSGSRKEGREALRALEIAAALAARECLERAGTRILEPWMRVEVSAPGDRLGEIAGSLARREGRVESIEDGGAEGRVTAALPLRTLFGLSSELGSAGSGRAGLATRFLRYEALRTAPRGA